MSDLNENVLDLIDKIDGNDNIEAEKLFNDILQTKIDALLDAAKTEVASSMFNTQECADCDAEVNEALKGGQHKIDMNKNGKLDAMDFKMLRGKKKGMKEEVELEEGAKETHKRASELADKFRKKNPEKSKVYRNLAIQAAKRSSNPTGVSTGKGPIGQGNKAQRRMGKTPVPSPMSSDRMRGYMEEVEQMDEASYSAKMARAGKDIGKPGKMFSKIAAKASRKYGKERGAKIAGAVLAKLRKKGK